MPHVVSFLTIKKFPDSWIQLHLALRNELLPVPPGDAIFTPFPKAVGPECISSAGYPRT